jgi:plasmid stability protein
MPHVQIRNMPGEMHRTFKIRAASEGMSLSEYLLKELRPIAALPSLSDVVAEIRSGPLVDLREPATEIIRAEREERDRQLVDRHRRVRRS